MIEFGTLCLDPCKLWPSELHPLFDIPDHRILEFVAMIFEQLALCQHGGQLKTANDMTDE